MPFVVLSLRPIFCSVDISLSSLILTGAHIYSSTLGSYFVVQLVLSRL